VCVCVCFYNVHNAVALSTAMYCSLSDKEPFVCGVTLHMNSHTLPAPPAPPPCLFSLRTETPLSICHSAANQRLQILTFHHPRLASPFFSPFLFRDRKPDGMLWWFKHWSTLSPLSSLLYRGQAGMWQHVSILPQSGLVCRRLTDGSASLKAARRDERGALYFTSFNILYDSQIFLIPLHVVRHICRRLQSGWWLFFYTVRENAAMCVILHATITRTQFEVNDCKISGNIITSLSIRLYC